MVGREGDSRAEVEVSRRRDLQGFTGNMRHFCFLVTGSAATFRDHCCGSGAVVILWLLKKYATGRLGRERGHPRVGAEAARFPDQFSQSLDLGEVCLYFRGCSQKEQHRNGGKEVPQKRRREGAVDWLCSPPIGRLKRKLQGDGIRGGGPWEVIRSQGWSHHDGISVLTKVTPQTCPGLPPGEDTVCGPEEGSHLTVMMPWSWTSASRTMSIDFCSL